MALVIAPHSLAHAQENAVSILLPLTALLLFTLRAAFPLNWDSFQP